MSQPKTSGRTFGFLKPFMRLCMCFDVAAEGEQRGRSKKVTRKSSSIHSIKSSPANSSGCSSMVEEDRDEKIKDVILYCKMNSPINFR
ncbi:hypothetical protein ISN44_As01g021700 [Arabidopsis suecica]|uniref:Uncharacterized protein n=1 Tax=Arabidopsis suecica TaxID=45249 RepID=A0A8T2H5J0_ARASU|nr:hypothetical protein ISN44_As01g021700 [Arabidopsis suecica]